MIQASSGVPRFSELGITPNLLRILEQQYLYPTPIQHRIIPTALQGRDVIGIAQTGTGKTLAFGVPLLQRLAENKGQGLIVLPTRELALQVDEMLHKIGRPFNLKTAVLIGGSSSYMQIQMLRRNPHIVVATPGRLIDHLQRRSYALHQVKIVVLDEADRMFDIGFSPQIKEIMNNVPRERQTMLFSATMPPEIAKLAAIYMKNPMRVDVAPSGTPADNIDQAVYMVEQNFKIQMLDQVLTDHGGTVLVFSRTKYGAKKITRQVQNMGYTAAEIHSNRSLGQRREALDGFKTGKYRVLVATDIASRGIDVKNISLVVNYDLPDNCEDYVHRIGRTGRAGKKGKALSFMTPRERSDIKAIERLINKSIPNLKLPILPPKRPTVQRLNEPDLGGDRRFQRRSNSDSYGSNFNRPPSRWVNSSDDRRENLPNRQASSPRRGSGRFQGSTFRRSRSRFDRSSSGFRRGDR